MPARSSATEQSGKASVAPAAALRGHLDLCTDNLIRGWAWDSAHPETRVAVDILVDGKAVARVTAQQYRVDLAKNGIGDGRHAFEYVPSPPIDVRNHRIRAVVAGTDMRLPRSEATVPLSFDDLTIPPPPEDMIFRVAGHRDRRAFLASGLESFDYIKSALGSAGFDLMQGNRQVLDWGCGCGRIARHWEPYASQIDLFGCDIYEPAVRWCNDNIPFGTFSNCNATPPLAYPDGQFDVIYGVSVLTHLSFDVHYLWMRELWRLLKPGGMAVLTISGPSLLPLTLQRISKGDSDDRTTVGVTLIDEEMFLCIQQEEGSNDTATVETYGAFTRIFYPYHVRQYRPRYGLPGIQDTYVLAKKSNASLDLIDTLFDSEMDGAEFRAEISLELRGQRHFGVLASTRDLICPATIRLALRLPGSDAPAAASRVVELPEKVARTTLQAAYAAVTLENVPEWHGPAVLSIEVQSTGQMDGVRLQLRNVVLF